MPTKESIEKVKAFVSKIDWDTLEHTKLPEVMAAFAEKYANERLAERDADFQTLIDLCDDIASGHRDPDAAEYNECDQPGRRCMWCEQFQAIKNKKEGRI